MTPSINDRVLRRRRDANMRNILPSGNADKIPAGVRTPDANMRTCFTWPAMTACRMPLLLNTRTNFPNCPNPIQ